MRKIREIYTPVQRAIGILSPSDFLRAKQMSQSFTTYDDFDDWLAEREGLQIGLSAAGVETFLVAIDFFVFLEWSRVNELSMSEYALDRLAAMRANSNSAGCLWLAAACENERGVLPRHLN